MKGLLSKLFLVSLLSLSLAACGSSSSSSSPTNSTTPPQTLTGKFIDGPVKGIKYTYGNYSGVTLADGTFSYLSGSSVTFKVGGIVIGSATGKGIVTPADLVTNPWDTSMAPSTQLLNITRFLIALDDGSVPGSITIPPAISTAAAGKTIDFSTAVDGDLTTLLGQLGIASSKLPSVATATTHLKDNIMQLFVGTYTGTWSGSASGGSDSGTFTINISTSGGISGTYTKTGGSGQLSGTMNSNYTFTLTSSGGSSVKGTIDPSSGKFVGALTDPSDSSAVGVFNGTKQ